MTLTAVRILGDAPPAADELAHVWRGGRRGRLRGQHAPQPVGKQSCKGQCGRRRLPSGLKLPSRPRASASLNTHRPASNFQNHHSNHEGAAGIQLLLTAQHSPLPGVSARGAALRPLQVTLVLRGLGPPAQHCSSAQPRRGGQRKAAPRPTRTGTTNSLLILKTENKTWSKVTCSRFHKRTGPKVPPQIKSHKPSWSRPSYRLHRPPV